MIRPRRVADPAQARAVADLVGWDYLLTTGRLRIVADPIPDPGNRAGLLALVEDRQRLLGPVRVLLAINATPEPNGRHRLVALLVPDWIPDPLTAVAWTYGDDDHPLPLTPAGYTHLTRRT
jgi:hypothetical protein